MDERDEIEPAEIYVLAELEAVLINRNFGSNGWGSNRCTEKVEDL